MKNLIPIILATGTSVLLVGCNTNMATIKNEDDVEKNIQTFKENFENYANINTQQVNAVAMDKYVVSVENNFAPSNELNNQSNLFNNDENLNLVEINKIDNNVNSRETIKNEEIDGNNTEKTEKFENTDFSRTLTKQNINNIENIENNKLSNISTLYNLTTDIENSCEEFCELKQNLTNAILETQTLIEKLHNNEIELTNEQKIMLSEQSMQLKSLARQLANATTELSLNLTDLNSLLNSQSDFDDISLKYLIVLDNLVNGNEMLNNGLNSLNLLNKMMKSANNTLPPNNYGRFMYGFARNGQNPQFYDYYLDENNNWIKNDNFNQNDKNKNDLTKNNDKTQNNNSNTEKTDNVQEVDSKLNIDTYKNNRFNSNIDTYRNNNQPHNIDTFFNTALLDNEFMYGNGGYAGMGMNAGYNPYMAGYNQNPNWNNGYGINQQYNTQYNGNLQQPLQEKQQRKKLKINKNIDTYRTNNTPTVRAKIGGIKSSISQFMTKFKKSKNKSMQNTVENDLERIEQHENADVVKTINQNKEN